MGCDVSGLSKSLTTYADWANGAKVDQVAGQKVRGQVANLENVTCGIARLFNYKSVGQARQEAIIGFKNALCNALGENLAKAAWKAAGGDTVKGLTAELVRKTLATATRLVEELHTMLKPAEKAQTMSDMSSKDVEGAVTHGRNKDAVRVAVAMAKSDALLCMSPGSQKACEALKESLQSQFKVLNDCASGFKGDNRNRIEGQMEALTAKMKEVDELEKNLPDGETAMKALAGHWKESLDRACEKLFESAPQNKKKALWTNLVALKKKYGDSENAKMLATVKREKKGVIDKIQKEIASCVKSALGRTLPNGVKTALADVFKNSHIEVLNRKTWAKIENKFDGFVGGRKISIESDIVSGRRIDDSIGNQYEQDVNAYNCHTRNTANAVNLATSKLQIGGKTVFSGVRHGVHSSKGVTGMSKQDANIQRAKQTVTAAFVTYLETHAKEVEKLAESGGPIPLNMTSLSLLTPVTIAPGNKEKAMFKDQLAAWNEINGLEHVEVQVNGVNYKVKPNVLAFNYGVNSGALTTTAGWGVSGGLNKRSLETLLGRANEFAKSCQDPTKAAVETLVEQVKYIADKKLERREADEAYKMPARLAVLSYLMGDVPVWNCKSGKDRTGMLDVEAKFLATLINQGQPIPEPGAKLTADQSQLLMTIMMKSGNLEMQAYNTGIAGYKLHGVDSIYRRAAADETTKKTLQGGSGYVGS